MLFYYYIQNSLHILEGYHITVTWPDTTLCWTPWDIDNISLFAWTRAEIQTVCYAALRLQGWSLARQEPIVAQAALGFAMDAIGTSNWGGQRSTASYWESLGLHVFLYLTMMMMTLRNIAKIASSQDFTDHTSRFLCGSQKKSCNRNGWFEIPDLASRRSREAHLLRFIVSKSRSSAVGVSYIQRSSTRLDAQIKSHNNNKLICIKSWQHAKTRLSKEGNELPKFCIFNEFERQPRSSKEGKVALQKCLYRI